MVRNQGILTGRVLVITYAYPMFADSEKLIQDYASQCYRAFR